jgi:hypothetical protein
MGAILPTDFLHANQPQIGFVNECGCLKKMTRFLSSHVTPGRLAQLSVYQGNELLKSIFVAAAPSLQKAGYLMCGVRRHVTGLSALT